MTRFDWFSTVRNSEPGRLSIWPNAIALGRLDVESLFGAELAPFGREPHAQGVVGPAVEDHQVVAAVAVEIHRAEHPGFDPVCGRRSGSLSLPFSV